MLPQMTPASEAPADVPTQPVADPSSNWGLVDTLTNMARSTGSTLTDAATYTGVAEARNDGSLSARPDVMTIAGVAGVNAAVATGMAFGKRVDKLTGVVQPLGETFSDVPGVMAANSIRITPTLASAVLGPAIADGATMLLPNLVPKYKDTKDIRDTEAKKAQEKSNQRAKIGRAVAAGALVGVAAGIAFLVKPELFKKFQLSGGSGLVDQAINGTTEFMVNGGPTRKLAGILTESQIRSTMGVRVLADDTIQVLKTAAGMSKDAVFTNRALMASAGGIGTLLLANHAAGEDDPDRKRLMWGLTAAAGAFTVGATYGIGKLTQKAATLNTSESSKLVYNAANRLANNDLLFKPNLAWIKKYATTIAPITAVPAGTAASQYFNIVSDFDDITAARSPFRK